MRRFILKTLAPFYRWTKKFFSGAFGSLELQDGRKIKVCLANDRFGRALGLSHLPRFPEFPLLFIFKTPGRHSFHMKDMRFPLDIVFLNESGQVVFVAYNQVPDDASFARPMIIPPAPAKYVLEIPAMSANTYGLAVGKTARFFKN